MWSHCLAASHPHTSALEGKHGCCRCHLQKWSEVGWTLPETPSRDPGTLRGVCSWYTLRKTVCTVSLFVPHLLRGLFRGQVPDS